MEAPIGKTVNLMHIPPPTKLLQVRVRDGAPLPVRNLHVQVPRVHPVSLVPELAGGVQGENGEIPELHVNVDILLNAMPELFPLELHLRAFSASLEPHTPDGPTAGLEGHDNSGYRCTASPSVTHQAVIHHNSGTPH